MNGLPAFRRAARWTSAELVTLAGTDVYRRHAFELARDAGMNMLRVGGTMVYECDMFYVLADEYGMLVCLAQAGVPPTCATIICKRFTGSSRRSCVTEIRSTIWSCRARWPN